MNFDYIHPFTATKFLVKSSHDRPKNNCSIPKNEGIDFIRSAFKTNNYPETFIDKQFQKFGINFNNNNLNFQNNDINCHDDGIISSIPFLPGRDNKFGNRTIL